MREITLPKNWDQTRLIDVFSIVNAKWNPVHSEQEVNYVGLENIEPHAGKLIGFRPTKSLLIKSAKTKFTSDDILYGKLRPYLNKVLTPSFSGICSTDLMVIRPKPIMAREFLAYFLRSSNVLSVSSKLTYGTKMPRMKIEEWADIKMPLPPLQIQKQIAKKLDYILGKIQDRKIRIEAIREKNTGLLRGSTVGIHNMHRNSPLLRMACYRMLGSFLGYRGANGIDKYDLPEGWKWAKTGEVAEGIVPGRYKPKTFDGTIPWITLPDIVDLHISKSRSNLGLTKDEVKEVRMKVMPKNSVLMSCIGQFGIVSIADCPVVPNQQFHGFVCKPEIIIPEYLAYSLIIEVEQMQRRSTATTIPYMNKSRCNSIVIALPSLDTQRKIVSSINQKLVQLQPLAQRAEKTLKLFEESVKHINDLQNAILSAAFKGNLLT